jgi:4-hydroxy-2-oxoheptanedioate aldolase
MTGPRFKDLLAGGIPRYGMWVVTGSAYCAEICAGSGLDWLLVDAEHAPNDLVSVLPQLQAVAAYPICPVVRPPSGDSVLIKQLLDIGVQNLVVPMVDSAAQAEALVRAVRYPPRGVRGVGSAFGRSSKWNRVPNYLVDADDGITLVVQIERTRGLEALPAIAAVDGVDGIFVGPSDLAASMGYIGQQDHPEVVSAVEWALRAARTAGKPAGVNAFARPLVERYLDAGATFVLVGADVTLLARGSEQLAATYIGPTGP